MVTPTVCNCLPFKVCMVLPQMVWACLLAVFQVIKVLNPYKYDKNMMHYYTDTGWDIACSLTIYYNDQESFYYGDKCIDRLFISKWSEYTKIIQQHQALGNGATKTAALVHYWPLINWRGLFTTSLGQRYNHDYLTSLFLAYSCYLIAIHTGAKHYRAIFSAAKWWCEFNHCYRFVSITRSPENLPFYSMMQ